MKTAVTALVAGLLGALLMYWQGRHETVTLRAEVERLAKLPAAASAAAQPVAVAAPESPAPLKPVEKIVTVKVPDDASTRQEPSAFRKNNSPRTSTCRQKR